MRKVFRSKSVLIILSIFFGLMVTFITSNYPTFHQSKTSVIDADTVRFYKQKGGIWGDLHEGATETVYSQRIGAPFLATEYINAVSFLPRTDDIKRGSSSLIALSFVGTSDDPHGDETAYPLGRMANWLFYGVLFYALVQGGKRVYAHIRH